MYRSLIFFIICSLLPGFPTVRAENAEDTIPAWLSGKKEAQPEALPKDKKQKPRKAELDVADKVIGPAPVVQNKIEAPPTSELEAEQLAEANPVPLTKKSSTELAATRGFFHDPKTNRYFNNGKTPLSLRMEKSKKGLETITVSLNDEEYIPYSGIINIEKEGQNLLSFRATDATGINTPIQDFKIYVDNIAPTIKSFWHGPNMLNDEKLIITGKSQLTLNAKDDLSGISSIIVEENDEAKEYKSPMIFTEGKHRIRYFAVDNVGNKSDVQDLEFTVDASAPTTTAKINGISHQTDSGTYVNNETTISLDSTDTASEIDRIEYKINNAAITTYRSPIHIVAPKMQLRYRSIDKSGNIEESKSQILIADSTPPELGLRPRGQYVQKGNKFLGQTGFYIYIDALDSESGIAEISVTKDGKNYEKTNEQNILFDKPGEFHLNVRAVDRVENIKESNSYVVIISDEGPKALLPDN